MQKYPIKGAVRNCTRWSDLLRFLHQAHATDMISGKSFEKMYRDLKAARLANYDDVGEFLRIRKDFSAALNGRAI